LSPAASPNAQDAALVKVHELERKLQDLEKHMQKQVLSLALQAYCNRN
jgi:hypothetical protein